MNLSRIRQDENQQEETRRRRHLIPRPPPSEALAIGPGQAPGPKPFRRRVTRCRCQDDSIIEVEEGARCPPGCNPITQGEAEEEERTPLVPFLFTAAFFGLIIFAVAKRPFG
ncbi:hypothetical protein LCGC14_0541160 [marine sediment metagenome]|uniref:Uncharacterized protein n=1 Tax=marine sediment metagenome TaxID=412755 RepID=A0A0F9SB60_9ZZZZ